MIGGRIFKQMTSELCIVCIALPSAAKIEFLGVILYGTLLYTPGSIVKWAVKLNL